MDETIKIVQDHYNGILYVSFINLISGMIYAMKFAPEHLMYVGRKNA